MAPTDIPARYAFTTTYIILSRTYTYTYYDYDYPTYTYDDWYSTYTYSIPTYRYPSYYDYYDNSGTRIALGVIFGLKALSLIILAIVYYKRQKKRKVWYGAMAAYYRQGGLPPWATAPVGVGDGSIKSPLVSPTQSAYPKGQDENSTQVSVYGNLPTIPYENPTGQIGYTAASSPAPVPQSLSPQPQHSLYSSTTGSSEPYSAPPTVSHSIVYAPFAGTPTQFNLPSSPAYGAPATHSAPAPSGTPVPPGTPAPPGDAPSNAMTYDAPPICTRIRRGERLCTSSCVLWWS